MQFFEPCSWPVLDCVTITLSKRRCRYSVDPVSEHLPAKEKLPFVEEELHFLGTQTDVRIQQPVEGFGAFR